MEGACPTFILCEYLREGFLFLHIALEMGCIYWGVRARALASGGVFFFIGRNRADGWGWAISFFWVQKYQWAWLMVMTLIRPWS